MSNQADHTIVRLRVPPELKKQIEDSAEQNNRSQSAEMVARLEKSFKHHSFEVTLFDDLKEPAASIEIGPITFGLYQSQFKDIKLYEMSLNSWVLSYYALKCFLKDDDARRLIKLGCTYEGSSIRQP